MTTPPPHGQVPEALRLAEEITNLECSSEAVAKTIAAAADELCRQHARIAELESELAAVGAGGVQALSAAPAGWKLVPVNPTPEMWKAAKTVPDPNPPYPPHYGLVWDAMLAATPTPPAEQQAAPKAVPGEQNDACAILAKVCDLFQIGALARTESTILSNVENTLRFSNMLGAVERDLFPQPDLPEDDDPYTEVDDNLPTPNKWGAEDEADYVSQFKAALLARGFAAPQQEAQEPAAYVEVSKSDAEVSMTWGPEPAGFNLPTGRYALYTAPQPAPAPLSDDVVKDAARYRFLAGHCRSTSEHWGGRWSIVVDGPAPKSHDSEDDFDEAVDAALAAQGGK